GFTLIGHHVHVSRESAQLRRDRVAVGGPENPVVGAALVVIGNGRSAARPHAFRHAASPQHVGEPRPARDARELGLVAQRVHFVRAVRVLCGQAGWVACAPHANQPLPCSVLKMLAVPLAMLLITLPLSLLSTRYSAISESE